jgi:hypothetical protein
MLTSTPYELEMTVFDRQRHIVCVAELARALRRVTRREPVSPPAPHPYPTRDAV